MDVKIDRSRYGYVYKITNLINGKTYVGQRKIVRDKSWEDYYGSGKLIQQAISKYGKENFLKELISYADSQEELLELEHEAITMFKSNGACEYNLAVYTPAPDNWQNLPPERVELWKQELSRAKQLLMVSEDYTNPRTKDFNKRYKIFAEKHSVEEISEYYSKYSSAKELSIHLKTSPRIIRRFLEENNLLKENRTNRGWGKRSDKEKKAISEGMRNREKKIKSCVVCEEDFKYVNDTAQICGSSYCRNELRHRRNEKTHKKQEKLQHNKKTVTPKTKPEIKRCVSCEEEKQFSKELCRSCFNNLFESKIHHLKRMIEDRKSIRDMSAEVGFSRNKIRKFMVDNGYEIPKQSADAAHQALSDKYTMEAYIVDCLKCGESFRSSKSEERKFCSNDCYNEYRKS